MSAQGNDQPLDAARRNYEREQRLFEQSITPQKELLQAEAEFRSVEADYNSAASDRQQWNTFSNGAPGNALRLLEASQTLQDLPVRQALFFYATWQNMGVRNLDLSAFVRRDSETGSRAQWIESRYRWDSVDVALRVLLYSGVPSSVYGSLPQPRRVEIVLRHQL